MATEQGVASTTVLSTSLSLPNIDKLEGHANYSSWKFAMKMSLVLEGLWEVVSDGVTDSNKAKDDIALAKVCLSVKPTCYVHVWKAKSSKEAWDNLERAFESKDMNRKFDLQRHLFRTKREDFSSMEAYVNDILSTVYKLADIGVAVDDDFVAFVMLNGLDMSYEPLVMALTYNNVKLSSDEVKSKLFEEDGRQKSNERSSRSENDDAALNVSKKIRCFSCGQIGHKKFQCPKLKKGRSSLESQKRHRTTMFSTAFLTGNSDSDWVVDSGCTTHMSKRRDWMINFTEDADSDIAIANGEKIKSEGSGNVQVNLIQGKRVTSKIITHIAYVPSVATNLLSVSKLTEKGYAVVFDKNGCKAYDDSCFKVQGKEEFSGTLKEGLYVLNQKKTEPVRALSAIMTNHTLWHRRLGHLNRKSMTKMKSFVSGLKFDDRSMEPCVACIEGKQAVQKFPIKKAKRAKELLGLIHTDVAGPMEEVSWGGARYCLTFTDDFSRKVFGYMLKSKAEVLSKFQDFKMLAENQTGKRIKRLRSDNGTEFCNEEMKSFLRRNGIIHQTTVAYTPQQNGVAERMNRTLVEKARCLLSDAKLGKKFWAEALNTSIYLRNRTPTAALKEAVPEEVWTGSKVDVSHLRIFGCKAQVHVPRQKRKKFDPKSRECILTGYCEATKGYRLIDLKNPTKVIVARDVIFLESSPNDSRCSTRNASVNTLTGQENSWTQPTENVRTEYQNVEVRSQVTENVRCDSNGSVNRSFDESENFCESEPDAVTDRSEQSDQICSSPPVQEERRYPIRDRKPKKDDDYSYLVDCRASPDPLSVEDARSRSDKRLWEQAMREELESLAENETWELVDRPRHKNVVKCKWVFKLKKSADGKIQRHKARLVAKGFSQKYGEDYDETFAPVVRMSTIRLLFALTAELDLEVEHVDITTAFLNGDLEEEIFMEQPVGSIRAGNENKVCRLKKALYGLKQAARSWNMKVHSVLIKNGFNRCFQDSCVYTRNNQKDLLIIALYVDDFYIFSNNKSLVQELKDIIKSNFKMKDLGEIRECLGMKVTRNRESNVVSLDQQYYTEELLKKFGMTESKPVGTPLELNVKLDKPKVNVDLYPYQELIGALMYLGVCTRPDIAHSVSYLSQFNSCHDKSHWTAAKRILRYLRGTTDYCLSYKRSGAAVVGYVDADWGNCTIDRHSYTGYVIEYAGGAVSWQSMKQRSVALSSTEAEYMALSEAAKEVVYLKNVFEEVYHKCGPITIHNDNQGTCKLSYNQMFHKRTKHISIRYHYVRDLVEQGEIAVRYLPTDKMPADTLTKGLPRTKHEFCSKQMGLGRKIK